MIQNAYHELDAAPHQDKLSAIFNLFIVFSPVILLMIISYFKDDIINQTQGFITLSPESFYWLMRITLIGAFIFMIYFFPFSNTIGQVQKPNDRYAQFRKEKDPLLGLRALACLNVLCGHWFLVVFGFATPALHTASHALHMALGFSPWGGVWIFFTLSGYLMGKGFAFGRHSIEPEGLKRFYKNRILRIFPIYFIIVFIVSVLAHPSNLDLRTHGAWNQWLETVLFDQRGGGVIGALWSVSTEFQFYIIAPFLFSLLSFGRVSYKKYGLFVFFLLMAFVSIKFQILIKTPELWHNRVYFPLLLNLDCFLVGMATALLVREKMLQHAYIKHGLFIGIVLAFILQAMLSIWSYREMLDHSSSTLAYYWSYAPAATALGTALLIILFELSQRQHNNNNRFLWATSTLFGTLTYCIYVIHEPILLSIRRLFPDTISIYYALKLFPFGLFLVLMTAYGLYYFIETKFDQLRY